MNIREEIYKKLDKMIQDRLNSVRNDYEFGSIEKTEFERISDEIEQEYNAYLLEMALASDSEVKEKMSDVLGCDFNFKREIKGL